MDKQNVVLFCGAGFSYYLQIPTMLKFADTITDCDLLSSQDRTLFNELVLECARIANTVGANARNLEDMGSALQMVRFANRLAKISLGSSTVQIDEAIALLDRCIALAVRPGLTSDEASNTSSRLSELSSNCNLTVVTTNYDLHVELAIAHDNKHTFPGSKVLESLANDDRFRGKRIVSCYSDESASSATLCKLHGSINWFRREEANDIEVEHRCSILRDYNELRDTFQIRGVQLGLGPDSWITDRASDCLIVPPTTIKTSLHDVLTEQWEMAAHAITNADQLHFIGYSFPVSDSFMRYFIGACLYKNSRIRRISVIDPNLAMFRSRIASVFATPYLQSMLQPYMCDWLKFQSMDFLERSERLADKLIPLE